MADRLEMLLEAERRGILPPDMKPLLDEARSRGLVKATDAGPLRSFGVGVRGALAGAAAFPAMIGDAANQLVNLGIEGVNELTGAEIGKLPSVSSQVESGLTDLGLPEPRTKTEKLAYAATRGGVGALTTAGGAGGIAATLPTGAAKTVATAMGAAPGVQAISGAAGEGAGEAVQQMGGSPGMQLVASLLAGIAAPFAVDVAREGGRAVLQAVPAIRDIYTKEGQQRIAGETIRRMSESPNTLVSRLDDAAGDIVPGSRRTLAEAADDIGLATAQRGMQSADPRSAAEFSRRGAERNAARRASLNAIEPGAEDATTVQDYIRQRLADFRGNADEIIQRAGQRAADRLDELGPGQTPERAGAILRQEFDAAYDDALRGVRQVYQSIDATGATIPTERAWESASQVANDVFSVRTGGTPANVRDFVARLRGAPLSFEAADQMQKEAANMASVFRRAGDNRAAGAMADIGRIIRDSITDPNLPGKQNFTAEQAAQYQAARNQRADVGVRFEQGASKPLSRTLAFGEQPVTPSEVPAAYFNTTRGAPDDAAKFIQAIGDRPQAVQALRDYAIDSVRTAAVDVDGTVNAQRWRAWMNRHAPALRQFPEIRDQLDTVERAASTVGRLQERAARTVAEVEGGAARFFLNNDPDEAIRAALSRKDSTRQMAALTRLASQDESGAATRGLRRAVIDYLDRAGSNAGVDAAGEQVMSQAKWSKLWADNEKALAPLFSPDHRRAIAAIKADLDSEAWARDAGRAVGSNTFQNLTTGALLYRMTGGALPELPNNAIARSIGRAFSWVNKVPEEEIRSLISDAMLDPRLARDLAAKATPQTVRNLGDALKKRVAALTTQTAVRTLEASIPESDQASPP